MLDNRPVRQNGLEKKEAIAGGIAGVIARSGGTDSILSTQRISRSRDRFLSTQRISRGRDRILFTQEFRAAGKNLEGNPLKSL